MRRLPSWGPLTLPLEENTNAWHSLVLGVAVGQIVLGILANRFSAENPLPWGKFKSRAKPSWGPLVPSWAAWMFQELPSALIPAALLLWSRFCQGKPFNMIVLMAFTLHYVHRVFIYSLRHYRLPESRRRDTVPLLLPLSAFMFCFVNGLAQSLSACYFDYSREMRGLRYLLPDWAPRDDGELEVLYKISIWDTLALFRFVIGLLIFFYGMFVNISADEHLLRLKTVRAHDAAVPPASSSVSPTNQEGLVTLRRSSRIAAKKDGDNFVTFKYTAHPHGAGLTAYKIPRSGWFQQVSCANYWGEICEWFGYAIMCNSVVAFSFAIFTLLFLGRRGVQTHKWYKGRFGANYPENRRAVIPYIL